MRPRPMLAGAALTLAVVVAVAAAVPQTQAELDTIAALNAHIDERIAAAGTGGVSQADFDALEARVATLETDLAAAQGQVATLESDLAATTTELERVKAALADAGGGTVADASWPAHWPQPDELTADEIAAVESATYLYSTWYGSPQGGLSPAAALAEHRGAAFIPFVQFGAHEYVVPSQQTGDVLGEAIIDAAEYLCPEPPGSSSTFWPAVLGPGDTMRGSVSRPLPVHCYWSTMPGAEWDGSTLVPSPTFAEVWGQ